MFKKTNQYLISGIMPSPILHTLFWHSPLNSEKYWKARGMISSLLESPKGV
jgi:hypothetical protein